MEDNNTMNQEPQPQPAPQPTAPQQTAPLPPHNNRMVFAILTTVFCCLISGIIAIVNASKANELYNSALYASDPSLRQSLYMESEARNKKARTWNIVGLVCGLLVVILYIILIVAGVAAADLL